MPSNALSQSYVFEVFLQILDTTCFSVFAFFFFVLKRFWAETDSRSLIVLASPCQLHITSFLMQSLSFDYKAIAANWLDEVKLKPVCQPTN